MPLGKSQTVGVVLVAAAVLGGLVFGAVLLTGTATWPGGTTPPNAGPSPTTTSAAPSASDPATGATTAQFKAPDPAVEVTEVGFPVNGTTTGLRPEDTIWLVTVANPRQGSDTYQPQDLPCTRPTADTFDCRTVYVGGPADGGRSYDIVLLRANPSVVAALEGYNRSDPAAHGYPGLGELPDGADIIGSVLVTREAAR